MTSDLTRCIRAHRGPIESIATHPTRSQFVTASQSEIAVWENTTTGWIRKALLEPVMKSGRADPFEIIVCSVKFHRHTLVAAYLNHGFGYVVLYSLFDRLSKIPRVDVGMRRRGD